MHTGGHQNSLDIMFSCHALSTHIPGCDISQERVDEHDEWD